jgi:hypothetical protein
MAKRVTYNGTDPIERMILREGLRIADVHPYKKLDLLAILLNSGDVLQARLSDLATQRVTAALEQYAGCHPREGSR